MAVFTSDFPTALDTNATLGEARNSAAGTLNASIDADDTSLVLTSSGDAAEFPDSGSLLIDSEIIFYSSKSGTTFSGLLRGQDSTTAASHTAPVDVKQKVIAAYHRVHTDAIKAIEAKLGTGADTAASGEYLKGTGAGASGWAAIAAGDLPTAIDAAKIADGSISNAEFQFLNGVSSAIQTQIDAKAAATVTLTAGAGLTGGGDLSANRSFAVGAGTGITVNADDVAIDASVVATLSGSQTLTNKSITSPTITTPTISGAITFPDNVRQTFNPGANAAGLNVGSLAGDPDTPSNGDLWYDSSANELTARINGANVALGAGGGGGSTPGGSTGELQFNDDGDLGGLTGSIVDGADVTFGGDLEVASANGRVWGISGLSSGHTVHFRYGGDSANEIECTFGEAPIYRAFHGFKFHKGGEGALVANLGASGTASWFNGNVAIGTTDTSSGQCYVVADNAGEPVIRADTASNPTQPIFDGRNITTAVAQIWAAPWLVMAEATANPTSTQLSDGNHFAMYRKADKLVIAFNISGTINYLTIDLDGSDTSWAQSTSAP